MDDLKNLNEDQQKQLLFMMLVQQHQQIGMMGLGENQESRNRQNREGFGVC